MLYRLAALLLIVTLQGANAQADGITVYPTTLLLDNSSHVGTLTISNQSDTEAVYELAGYRWTDKGGEDTLTLDKSFIVTPPVVTLAAGEERIVRVGLMSVMPASSVEQAWRLRISELRPHSKSSGSGLNVRLQLLLPVFSSGNSHEQELNLSARAGADGQVCIAGKNMGDTHAKLVWVAATDAADHKVPVQKYLLAGSQAEFCLDPEADTANGLIVGATSAYLNEIRTYQMAVADP